MKILILFAILSFSTSAFAGELHRYDQCMALAQSNPKLAFEQATAWRMEKVAITASAVPAMHCQAVALVGLGQAARAGGLLDAAATALGNPPKNSALAGQIWAQSGNAWLLAEDSLRAEQRLTRALGFLPPADKERAAALIDRARARVDRADKGQLPWKLIQDDLALAHTINPTDAVPLLLSATAHRRAGEHKLALGDIEKAAALAPDNSDVLLERGVERAQAQNVKGAVADWQQVANQNKNSDTAKRAKAYLLQVEGPEK